MLTVYVNIWFEYDDDIQSEKQTHKWYVSMIVKTDNGYENSTNDVSILKNECDME